MKAIYISIQHLFFSIMKTMFINVCYTGNAFYFSLNATFSQVQSLTILSKSCFLLSLFFIAESSFLHSIRQILQSLNL